MSTQVAAARQWQRDYQRVADAITFLDTNRRAQPDLEEVAAALHLSPRHLHRTFVRFAGVSPQRLLRWLTMDAARTLLRERATVLDTVAVTGLSSSGRLHDLTVTLEGVTPGQLSSGGDGLGILCGVHPTPLGPVLAAVTDRGILALRFLESDGEPGARTDGAALLRQEWPRADVVADPDRTAEVAARLVAVLDGTNDGPPLRVVAPGTNLQIRVWEALLRIPERTVATYGQVAQAVGEPRAVRAVASAVGRNPVAALIPCHRVLRSTGHLGGYRWGTTRKRVLLAREAVREAS